MNHPLHAALWATKLCDITGNNTDALEQPREMQTKRSQMWHEWFRKRVADNMPYDEIVKGVLTATSREGKAPEEWIEDADRTWLFSFQNICDVLGLDADYLRRGLRVWKERALEGRRGKVVSLRADERDELRKVSGD